MRYDAGLAGLSAQLCGNRSSWTRGQLKPCSPEQLHGTASGALLIAWNTQVLPEHLHAAASTEAGFNVSGAGASLQATYRASVVLSTA